MNLIQINDISIPELSIYKNLRDGAFSADNSFIADSPKVVNILLKTQIKVKSILATQEYYDEFGDLLKSKDIASLYVTSKEQMQNIVGHKIHHNCMLHGIRPQNAALEDLGESIVMLDNITSSENVGSIARSMAALGIDSYLLPNTSPHPFNRRALRVSMGHSSYLNISIYEDIKETILLLKRRGYRVYAAEVQENSTPLNDVKVTQKWVLLMGHEGKGISPEILELCDEVVTIEMKEGIKSFNVSVAASIMMYKFINSVNITS